MTSKRQDFVREIVALISSFEDLCSARCGSCRFGFGPDTSNSYKQEQYIGKGCLQVTFEVDCSEGEFNDVNDWMVDRAIHRPFPARLIDELTGPDSTPLHAGVAAKRRAVKLLPLPVPGARNRRQKRRGGDT